MFKKINVINIIKEAGGTVHSPLVVLGSDYNSYFLKTPKDLSPEINIINEFLANGLLNLWNIKTPQAAMLSLDANLLPKNISPNHKYHYFKRTCFGSRSLENAVDLSELNLMPNQRYFHNINDFFKIALFDIWVENDDRKPSNFNLMAKTDSNKYHIYAIDHCFIFSSLNYKDLNPNHLSVSFNDSILETSFMKIMYNRVIKKDWFVNLKDYFYFSIERCKIDFTKIINCIPNDLGLDNYSIEKIYRFLFSDTRNKKVFEEFCGRFKS